MNAAPFSLSASSTAETPEQAVTGYRILLAGLAVILVVRLILATHLPLTEDEAYYRLWAQHLQPGYYDHPPVIAWWVSAGMTLAGDTPLGVRLMSAVSSSALSLILYAIALEIGTGTQLARRAAWWLQGSLLIAAGGFSATPDSPSVLFWTLTLLMALKARNQSSVRWWVLAGLTAGLATLSKYSALFLAPGILAWLLIDREGRRQLTTLGPWLAAITAIAVFMINVVWNAGHEWVTFNKQFGRVAPDVFDAANLPDFLLAQFALLNPLIALGLIVGLIRKHTPEDSPATNQIVLLAATTTLPFLVYLMAHALHSNVQAHWPVPLYPALVLAAASLVPRLPNLMQTILRWCVLPFAFFILALAVVLTFFPRSTGSNLAFPIQGWPELASDIRETADAENAEWIGVYSYATVAMYDNQPNLQGLPALQLFERDRYLPGHSSWSADMSRPGLIIDLARRIVDADLTLCFDQIERLPDIRRTGPTGKQKVYGVVKVSGARRDVPREGCWAQGEPPSRIAERERRRAARD